MGMSACSQRDNEGQDIDVTEILQGMDEYKTKFIGLYTSNVYEDTESAVRIEGNDFIYMNEQIATLTRYSNFSDDHLRYKIQIDGETGNVIVNYYLCEGFVWINKQRNYYSSWVPDKGYPDILYSETEQWILIGETVYILHDNGELEEVPWEQLNIPTLEELDEIMSCDFESVDFAEEQAVPFMVNAAEAPEPEPQKSEPDETKPRIMEWKDKIYLSVEDYLGNILGYTLCSDGDGNNIWYEMDLDYLLAESAVGNGVFVSEHMYETEAFIGTLLKEILAQQGEIGENRRQYFTEEAVRTLDETDWSLLDEKWEVTPYSYGKSYTLNHVFGEAGYDFFYVFEPDGEKITREETQHVSVTLSINSSGIIYDIWAGIYNVPTKSLGPANEVSLTGGMFRSERYTERIITDGFIEEGKILLDYSVYHKRFNPDYQQENRGLLVSGDAAVSAAGFKEIIFRSMNGEEVAASEFAADLKRITWEDLGDGWIPEEMYDCYYIDEIEQGYVSFKYYFYPDYTAMGVKEANVAVVSCTIRITEGDIYGCGLTVFSMTQPEYEAAKERRGSERRLLVDKGSVLSGRAAVEIPIPNEPLVYMPLSEYQVKEEAEEHYARETAGELWGFQDAADVASYLGDKFLRDFDAQDIHNGEIDEMCLKDNWQELDVIEDYMLDEGWMSDRCYDCYYIMENECAGCMHLRYYFYSRETNDMNQWSGKAAVVDVYLSEKGIEDIQISII